MGNVQAVGAEFPSETDSAEVETEKQAERIKKREVCSVQCSDIAQMRSHIERVWVSNTEQDEHRESLRESATGGID